MVIHVEYAPRALLRLEKDDGTDRRTDGRTPDRYITLTVIDTANLIRARIANRTRRLSVCLSVATDSCSSPSSPT